MGYSLNASADNCYKGTTCLINKFDIRDEKLLAETEADITFMKSVMLDNNPIEGCFDFEHYKAIHRFLFCDIYDWAGEIRTVNISKKGTAFTKADSIERIATACFKRITSGCLADLTHDEFMMNSLLKLLIYMIRSIDFTLSEKATGEQSAYFLPI